MRARERSYIHTSLLIIVRAAPLFSRDFAVAIVLMPPARR